MDRLAKWRNGASVPPAAGAELTPYAVMFAMPAGFNYAGNVNVDAYKGLLYAEALGVSGGGDGRLLAVWRDRPAYEAAKASFLDNTGLPPQVLWEGYHLDVRRPGKPWWRRLTPAGVWAALATLSLVLTNLQTIWSGYGWLVGPPDIQPVVPAEATNVLVNEPFRFEVMERNTRTVGDCSIEFTEESADRPGGLAFDPLMGGLHPGVKPDGTAVLTVSGKGLQEGLYQVRVNGRAKAGVIPSTRDFMTPPAVVRVWGEAPHVVSGPVKKLLAGGKACEAEFELKTGRGSPDGIVLQALLLRFPGVRFDVVRFPGTTQFTPGPPAGAPGKEVASIKWKTSELLPKHAIPFTLLLESMAEKGKTAEDWDTVVQAVQFVPQPGLGKEIE